MLGEPGERCWGETQSAAAAAATAEILTDKFDGATFFLKRYILRFYGSGRQLFSDPVAQTSDFGVMEA